jgi:hypothetical protein
MALLWTPTRSPPEIHSRIFFWYVVAFLQIQYNMFWLYYASKVHYMKIGSSLCKTECVEIKKVAKCRILLMYIFQTRSSFDLCVTLTSSFLESALCQLFLSASSHHFYVEVHYLSMWKFGFILCGSSILVLVYCTKDRQINKMVFPTMYHPYNGVSYFPDNSEEKLNKN